MKKSQLLFMSFFTMSHFIYSQTETWNKSLQIEKSHPALVLRNTTAGNWSWSGVIFDDNTTNSQTKYKLFSERSGVSGMDAGNLNFRFRKLNKNGSYVDLFSIVDSNNSFVFNGIVSGTTPGNIIVKTGKVGIGVSSPSENLDIAGLIKIQKASTQDNNSPGITCNNNDDFKYKDEYINQYGFGFHGFQDGTTSFENPTNAYVSGHFGIDFFTGGGHKMRISRNGEVSIGTTKRQSGYKLLVDGKIKSEELKVEIVDGTGPDYVFEDDYPLASLDEIKAYISANKHLPEVPSAKEMEANGIELGEMNMLLLKKIEELTLLLLEERERTDQKILELQKESIELRSELENIKSK